MPWIHCGDTLTDDVRVCPTCGGSKAVWTTRLDRTRTFTLGTEWDGDASAQAEALKDAEGPFCEECQKAANDGDDSDDSDADEEEDPGADEDDADADADEPDAEAQAETLADAADSGAPFCEECQAKANEEAA